MVFLSLILNAGILIRTIRAEWSVLEVVLVGVGAGGSPADDGGGHWEPPPHTHQTHPEPDCRRTEEVFEEDRLAMMEESREEQDQSGAGEPHSWE